MMLKQFAAVFGLVIAVMAFPANAQDANALWDQGARSCARMNADWARPTAITIDLLHQGHRGVRRCINDSRGINEASDIAAVLDQVRAYRKNGSGDHAAWIARLTPLVPRSLVGVESELYALYSTDPTLPDRDAQLLRWTLAYAEKKPSQAYLLSQGYQAGKWGVPMDKAAAVQVLRRGAVSGCVECMKALINRRFQAGSLYKYSDLQDRATYALAEDSATDEEREILLVLMTLVDGARNPLVYKTNEELQLNDYLADDTVDTPVRRENRILREAAALISPNNAHYGFDILAADHYDSGLRPYLAVTSDTFRRTGGLHHDEANNQAALVDGEYRVEYLDGAIRHIDGLPAAERAKVSHFRS